MTEPADMIDGVVLPFGHEAEWGHKHSMVVRSTDGGSTWVAVTPPAPNHVPPIDHGVIVPFGAEDRQALQNVRRVTSPDGATWHSRDADV